MNYDSKENPNKQAFSFTKGNSERWVTKTITIEDAAFLNRGPRGSDLNLENLDDEDDVFHMIEITKNK